jgi:hypothetical protein
MKMGGPQGRLDKRENSPLPVFDPRTVQSVTSRYIPYTIPESGEKKYVFFYFTRTRTQDFSTIFLLLFWNNLCGVGPEGPKSEVFTRSV